MCSGVNKLGVPPPKKIDVSGALLHAWQIASQILQQRVDVLRLRNLLRRGVRIEIAVRALPHTPRHVDVK